MMEYTKKKELNKLTGNEKYNIRNEDSIWWH